MTSLAVRAFALVVSFSLSAALAACSDEAAEPGGGSSGSSGASSSGGSSGASSSGGSSGASSSGGSSGASSSGGAGGGTFWYISRDSQVVGVSDLSGADVWSETLQDSKPRSLAVGAGAAWVLTDAGDLLRYDLATHARAATVAVAKVPSHLAIAGGAVWVTDDNDGSECTSLESGPAKLIKVDPSNNSVTSTLPIAAADNFPCNGFDGMVSDGTALYLLIDNQFGLARVDAASGTVTNSVALGSGAGFGTGYLALGGQTLWVHDTSADTLIAVGTSELNVSSTTPISADFLGELMVASSGAVYLDKPGTDLLRVDANNPSSVQVLPVLDDSADTLTLRGDTLYASVRPDLSSVLVDLDPTTLAERARRDLPVLSHVNAVVFVD